MKTNRSKKRGSQEVGYRKSGSSGQIYFPTDASRTLQDDLRAKLRIGSAQICMQFWGQPAAEKVVGESF